MRPVQIVLVHRGYEAIGTRLAQNAMRYCTRPSAMPSNLAAATSTIEGKEYHSPRDPWISVGRLIALHKIRVKGLTPPGQNGAVPPSSSGGKRVARQIRAQDFGRVPG